MAGEGKHALLEVPDSGGGRPPIRASAPPHPSAAALARIRPRGFRALSTTTARATAALAFVSAAERKAESPSSTPSGVGAIIPTGNRITTTPATRSKAIGGNYRLLILGRGTTQSGLDVSGGHVTEVGERFAAAPSSDWVQDYGGNVAGQRDEHQRHRGKHLPRGCYRPLLRQAQAELYRDRLSGQALPYDANSLDDSKAHPTKTVPKLNPRHRRTGRGQVYSGRHPGSSALRVPLILDETWAYDYVGDPRRATSPTRQPWTARPSRRPRQRPSRRRLTPIRLAAPPRSRAR